MVKAILSGTKTQTRRLLPEWCNDFGNVEIVKDPELCDQKALEWNELKEKQCHGLYACFDKGEEHLKCKYAVGDIIYVRETFYAYGNWVKNKLNKSGKQKFKFLDFTLLNDFKYRYEDNKPLRVKTGRTNEIGWYKRPSLFMPKEAARIFLEITDIRAERLNDISEDDAIAEGIYRWTEERMTGKPIRYQIYQSEKGDDSMYCSSPINSYESLWESINGKGSWDSNSFVLAITFKTKII